MLSQDLQNNLLNRASKLSDVELFQLMNFAEFLISQREEKSIINDSLIMSAQVFKDIWDNEDDAIYDKL